MESDFSGFTIGEVAQQVERKVEALGVIGSIPVLSTWFTKDWWGYLLEKPLNLTKFFCRIKGHRCGPVWYNVGGLEPDMHCSNCYDDLS